MAGCLSKREELLGLIPDLQCHECKNVPGPNGNQKNRYSCFDESHTLCEEHKNECPCGSKVGKSPSPVIAKFLQNLPWMCQNYRTGCRESKMNVEDLEHHQGKCIYRVVWCPRINCGEEGKVLFKDVIDHLKICLKEPIEDEQMNNGEANEFSIFHDFLQTNFELKNGDAWYPTKMTSTCGAVFFTTECVKNETVYLCIRLLGSPDEARKYSCAYSVTNKSGEKFNYIGPVHTIDKNFDDIITSGSLLALGINAGIRSLNDDAVLEVEITIRNLKEEAKDDDMESGVSDGE